MKLRETAAHDMSLRSAQHAGRTCILANVSVTKKGRRTSVLPASQVLAAGG